MTEAVQSPKGLQYLLRSDARMQLRTLMLFAYFIIFQFLILSQKPFLQFHFAMYFYVIFAGLFAHHSLYYLWPDSRLTSYLKENPIISYSMDFILIIVFMRAFPQLSSFVLVQQLFLLFLASFDLTFAALCTLGFVASAGTSVMNMLAYQSGSTQSLLSLSLFNLSYMAVIVISEQLREEISVLRTSLSTATRKIKSQEEFSKTLIEKMPLGLLLTQSNQDIVLRNSYLSESLKLSDFELKSLIAKFSALTETSSLKQSDFEYENKNSLDRFIYQIDHAKYFDEEIQSDLTMMLIKDVTEVRHLEDQLKQQEKLAAVGQLAAGIAHEIRNPLAGISGSIQLLTQDNLDPEQMKLMRIVLKEIDRLNNLITEFLDYAKPEKKPDQKVNLKALIEEVVLNVKGHKDHNEKFVWQLQLTDSFVLGHSDKLRQVLLNILINAIQATKDQVSPLIKVEMKNENDQVVFSVIDNGIGMSPETKKRMFEPFHTTKPKGTGLGLAITHKILESHGAIVVVNSEINKGTDFKLKFPSIGSREET